MAFIVDGASAPNTVNSSVARTREYLTANEVEDLMATARKSNRYGHRDASMILIAYRHGLRASEICDLQWHQVELNAGRLPVRRTKRGTPSVHPIQGDELRSIDMQMIDSTHIKAHRSAAHVTQLQTDAAT